MANFDPCLLHIPNKEWADDPRELDNYKAIERWARRLRECGCECYLEFFDGSTTAPASTWTQILMSSVAKIGTVDTAEIGVWMFNNRWQANSPVAAGEIRVLSMNGNPTISGSDTVSAPGLDMTPAGIGIQSLYLNEIFALFVTPDVWVFQNSVAPLTVQIYGYIYALCGCRAADLV